MGRTPPRYKAFQLTFLTHVPKHAAVNESVELANHVGAPKAKGFVNGVLRRVSELVTDDFTETAGSDAVPFGLVEFGFPGAPLLASRGPTPPAPLPRREGGGERPPELYRV